MRRAPECWQPFSLRPGVAGEVGGPGSIMCPYEKLRLMLLSMHLRPPWDNKLMKCHFLPLDNVWLPGCGGSAGCRRQPPERDVWTGVEEEMDLTDNRRQRRHSSAGPPSVSSPWVMLPWRSHGGLLWHVVKETELCMKIHHGRLALWVGKTILMILSSTKGLNSAKKMSIWIHEVIYIKKTAL